MKVLSEKIDNFQELLAKLWPVSSSELSIGTGETVYLRGDVTAGYGKFVYVKQAIEIAPGEFRLEDFRVYQSEIDFTDGTEHEILAELKKLGEDGQKAWDAM